MLFLMKKRAKIWNYRRKTQMIAKISGEALRLRIFIGDNTRWHHQPLYHAIVLKSREMGMAGATVTRAVEGFGQTSRIHTVNLLNLSSDLPIVIEIVDSKEYIERFLPVLDTMVEAGLITTDSVRVVKYTHSPETGLHIDREEAR
jgi:PII-like signaling protein